MKRFHFSLETLHRKREQEEREKQLLLAKVADVYNKEEAAKNNCLDMIKENIEFSNTLDYSNADDINTMIMIDDSNFALRGVVASHDNNLEKIKPELLKRQKVLAEFSAKKRAVEVLRERQYKEYQKYVQKEEQKVLDEFVAFNSRSKKDIL